METITLDTIHFTASDMFSRYPEDKRKRSVSREMTDAAERAYAEGVKCVAMRSAIEIYPTVECSSANENIELYISERLTKQVHLGRSVGYMIPAKEIAVVLCTVGAPLVLLLQKYAKANDCLMMYYIDLFGILALNELAAAMRKYVEDIAASKGWGVGPSMKPGSAAGWGVEGQRELYSLGHGENIGLTINAASFLIPHISNSFIVGLGPHYLSNHVGSLCSECLRYRECLWRRENIEEEANGTQNKRSL